MRLALLSILLFLLLAIPAQASPPVVVLILDEFPGTSVENSQGQVSSRLPHLARIAQQATYYPNATTNADLTMRAVPALSSGMFREDAPTPSSQTFYKLLRPTHNIWRYEEFASLPELCDFCTRSFPQVSRFDGITLADTGYIANTVKATLAAMPLLSTPTARPLFWNSHIVLPHAPYRFLPSGNQYPLTGISDSPGVSSEGNLYSNRYLPLAAQQRFLLQAQFTDKIIGQVKKQMIKGKIWDESLFIVVADHGASFQPSTSRRLIEKDNYDHIASIPLLIKYPGQKRAAIDRGSAQSVDILPTVAEVTGLTPDWPVDGLSLLHSRPEREVKVFGGGGTGWMYKSFARFIEGRSQLVKLWNERFPGTPEGAWLGPQAELRGRSLRRLAVRPSSFQASIEQREQFVDVKLRSGTVPALISGTIEKIEPGIPLAVALNGRLVAAGYSYRVGQQTRFTILLPENKFRSGNNSLTLLAMTPRGFVKING